MADPEPEAAEDHEQQEAAEQYAAEQEWAEQQAADWAEEIEAAEWWDGAPVSGDEDLVWAKVPKGFMVHYTPTSKNKGKNTPARTPTTASKGKNTPAPVFSSSVPTSSSVVPTSLVFTPVNSTTPFLASAKKDRTRKGIDVAQVGDIDLRKIVGTYSKDDSAAGVGLVSWVEQALETLAKRNEYKTATIPQIVSIFVGLLSLKNSFCKVKESAWCYVNCSSKIIFCKSRESAWRDVA